MTEWKTYKLGDIAKFQTGKLNSNAAVENGKYPFFTCSPNTLAIDNYAFDKEAILLAGNNAEGNFSIKYYKGKFNAYQRTYIIETYNDICDIKFLFYALKLCLQQFKLMSQGTSTKFLTAVILNNFEISLPGLEEQRRIAGILGAIDDKIENNRRINTNLELQAQALYKQWFVDFEFPNEEDKPYKSSGSKMIDSELGLIPESWSVGDIYKYVNVVYGAPYKSVLFNERKDGNPLIRIRDLKTFSPQYYTQEILPNTEYVNAGDVVAGMDAEFVPCLWMGEKGVLNQRCCKFASKQDSISNYYVMFLVKPELEFVQSYKTGTTVSHLGKADIDKFVVIQPPLIVIEEFSKIADALLYNKVKLAKENITLAILRDTLLPKLMNGEIITK